MWGRFVGLPTGGAEEPCQATGNLESKVCTMIITSARSAPVGVRYLRHDLPRFLQSDGSNNNGDESAGRQKRCDQAPSLMKRLVHHSRIDVLSSSEGMMSMSSTSARRHRLDM